MRPFITVLPRAKEPIKNFVLDLFRRYHFRVCDSIERFNNWRDSTMVDEAFCYYIPTVYLVCHTKVYAHGYASPIFRWVIVAEIARRLLNRFFRYAYRRVERAALRSEGT